MKKVRKGRSQFHKGRWGRREDVLKRSKYFQSQGATFSKFHGFQPQTSNEAVTQCERCEGSEA